MKYHIYLVVLLILLPVATMAENANISRNNYVSWIAASSKGTSTSHFVQWKIAIDPKCTENRTRFSIEDKEIMSLLLAAKLANKKLGFYYTLATRTGSVYGHGTNCQLVNVWLEPEK